MASTVISRAIYKLRGNSASFKMFSKHYVLRFILSKRYTILVSRKQQSKTMCFRSEIDISINLSSDTDGMWNGRRLTPARAKVPKAARHYPLPSPTPRLTVHKHTRTRMNTSTHKPRTHGSHSPTRHSFDVFCATWDY